MRKKMSLRNILGICVCAVAALFLAEPLTVLLLLPVFSAGGQEIFLCFRTHSFLSSQDFFSFSFRTSLVLIPKRKSSRNDFPWTPGIVRGVTRNLPPGIDCVNG